MPELVFAQRTDEWLEARLGKITASLAAACLGLDPHCSARKAWRTILGTEPKRDNWHVRRGQQFEVAARLDYEVRTGNIVRETGLWVHPVCEWLAASPDGLIGDDGLGEFKCPLHVHTHVPIKYRIQCLIQLACTERVWCDFHSWGAYHPDGEPWEGGQNPNVFTQRVFRAGIPNLIVRLKAFYETYVLPGIEPPRKGRKR